MTSERTPQDVLREAREAVEALRITRPTSHGQTFNHGIDAALKRLDKAIAEAPDSPHCDHGMAAHGPDGCLHCVCAVPGHVAAPDTLSEKPGLDVERLARAVATVHAALVVADHHRAHAQRIAAEYERPGSTVGFAPGSTDSEGR